MVKYIKFVKVIHQKLQIHFFRTRCISLEQSHTKSVNVAFLPSTNYSIALLTRYFNLTKTCVSRYHRTSDTSTKSEATCFNMSSKHH